MKLKQKMRQKFTAVNIYIKKKTEVKPQLSGGRSKRQKQEISWVRDQSGLQSEL